MINSIEKKQEQALVEVIIKKLLPSYVGKKEASYIAIFKSSCALLSSARKIFKVLWLSGLSEVLLILFTEVQVLLRPYII